MSLKSKIEAIIYASEEPVTLLQLAGVLGGEAQAELDALDARQPSLDLAPLSGPPEAPNADTTDGQPAPEAAAGTVDDAVKEAEPAPTANEAQTPATDAVPEDPRLARERDRRVRDHLRRIIDTLIRDYAESDRGIEIREVAGGFRMATKPEFHDAVRGFVRSLKPALRLTLQALETLAVVAYKQPVTAAEISEIRGVDSAGVLGGLIGRKLLATAGRKQVIGRPMLYKTTKEFLVRFGLRDIHELPSMEEFERLAGELTEQEDLPMEPTDSIIERANARGDAEHVREATAEPDATNASQPESGKTADDATGEPVPSSPAGNATIKAPDESTSNAEEPAAQYGDTSNT